MHTAYMYEYITLLLYFQVHTDNFGIIYMYHVYLCTVYILIYVMKMFFFNTFEYCRL